MEEAKKLWTIRDGNHNSFPYWQFKKPLFRIDPDNGRATPFLRRQIGSRVHLRRVPEIEFRFDESIAHQDRIEQILQDLHRAAAASQSDAGEMDTVRKKTDDDDLG